MQRKTKKKQIYKTYLIRVEGYLNITTYCEIKNRALVLLSVLLNGRRVNLMR